MSARPAGPPEVVELREKVQCSLREQFGSASTDDVGDFMLDVGGADVWVSRVVDHLGEVSPAE